MLSSDRKNALELSRGHAATPTEIARVAEVVGDEAARWAFTQWTLRERGRVKFAEADAMLFDREGLEMATQEPVAAFHASLFDPHWHVADLTAGLGSDLIALARRCEHATGFELNPDRAELLRHNLEVNGQGTEIIAGDSLESEWSFDAAFADPARRRGGRRSINPDDFEPDPRAILERGARLKRIVMKLSPLLNDSDLAELGSETLFVSHRRECLEALTISDGEPGVRAVHIESSASLPQCPTRETVSDPLTWIHEADPAAIRADALGGFGIPSLGTSRGWLTGPEPIASPWLRGYFLVWSGPWRTKTVQSALRDLSGRVEAVKTRGVALDPAQVAKSLRGEGEFPLILMLYAAGPKVRAALAQRKFSDSP